MLIKADANLCAIPQIYKLKLNVDIEFCVF